MRLGELGRYAAAAALAGVVGVGVGRYSAPPKVETRERTVYVTRAEAGVQVVERTVAGPVRTRTVTIERTVPCAPGAAQPVRETTTTVEAGPTESTRGEAATLSTVAGSSTDQTSAATRDQPRLMLSAGALVELTDPLSRPAWSAGASYRLAGPFWLGAAYQSTGHVEARLSLTF